MKKLLLTGALFLAFAGCSNRAKESNKATFEKYYGVNLERCVDAMRLNKNIDSITAAEVCSCMIHRIYEIDSTALSMNGEEVTTLVRKHAAELKECLEVN
ncbi:MAG: hypothetical protein LBN24_04070 [Mediterranea sp.]|jgi:hypothetical protein|nr:hypothetical protein [Mediterranea sp.]